MVSEAHRCGVPVMLVCTKMDAHVRNAVANRRNSNMTPAQVEAAFREGVRDDVASELRRFEETSGVRVPSTAIPVYFIDSLDLLRGEYRFDEKALIRELVRSAAARRSGAATAAAARAAVTPAAR
jgi:hypothetical protein